MSKLNEIRYGSYDTATSRIDSETLNETEVRGALLSLFEQCHLLQGRFDNLERRINEINATPKQEENSAPNPELNDLENSLLNLLRKITKGGGIHCNPYCVQEVVEALKALAKRRGIKDYYDAHVLPGDYEKRGE